MLNVAVAKKNGITDKVTLWDTHVKLQRQFVHQRCAGSKMGANVEPTSVFTMRVIELFKGSPTRRCAASFRAIFALKVVDLVGNTHMASNRIDWVGVGFVLPTDPASMNVGKRSVRPNM